MGKLKKSDVEVEASAEEPAKIKDEKTIKDGKKTKIKTGKKTKVKGAKSKTKSIKTKSMKVKKSIKRAGATAGRSTLAFNISGCKPKLVKILDKAAAEQAKKDGGRVSRSRLVNSVLEAKFL